MRTNIIERKNWLFAGSTHGVRRIAMMYSIVECSKQYNIAPDIYLEDIIGRIYPDNTKMSELKELLPLIWLPLTDTVTVGNLKS